MSEQAGKQPLILAVLLIVLVAVLYWQFGGSSGGGSSTQAAAPAAVTTPAARGAAPSNPVSGGRGRGRSGGGAMVTDVRLDELERAQQGELANAERNPFRFRTKPAPPPPRVAVQAPPSEPPPPVVPAGPPPPPPIALRFIGVIESPPPAGRVAILSDGRGGPTIPGREGDIIEGRYRLLRVGPDSIDMAYLDGRGRQTIRLSGQ